MKIVAANIFVVPVGNRTGVILELETDQGISGLGEAGIAYGMGTEATAAMVAQLVQSVVLGQNPGPVELIWSNLYERGYWTKGGGAITSAAMSAIEVALWDIKGKALGVPVYSLFGGPFRDKIDTYANGWWMGCETAQDFAKAGQRAVEAGARGLKLYPLGLMDPETVIRHPIRRRVDPGLLELAVGRVRELRAAVGPGVDILLDLGGGLHADQMRPLLRRLAHFDVGFAEEPMDPGAPDALRNLDRPIPCAAGERVYMRYGFHRLLGTGAVDILQPDICNVGGLAEARRIAAMGEVHNTSVSPHNYGTTLASVIAVQFSASIPNFRSLEIFPDFHLEPGYIPLIDQPVEQMLDQGRLPLPQGAGLGVSLRRSDVEGRLWRRIEGAG
ncbi:MAG: mandelate racemase/muconate lactonizing enzyme family protein [Rhodobacteraceae bacterium]|nr:mandelate racemase/muconate lactonizing enzyme family protein [Paracoccaceae bacterium]MCY4141781.1 mandelate racemase/muconate lactonizing enzyme family protein [Paracoccaceae bacterium]